MDKRHVLAFLGAGLMSAALAGCTSFAPVYGDMSSGMASARFNFAPPTNRLEQIILNRLSVAFPAPAGPEDPVLKVTASAAGASGALSKAFAVGEPGAVRVQAAVRIVQGEAELFSATRFTDTSYQGGKLAPTNQASLEGARETAAESTAEALRAAILAGYRPGAVSTPPR